MFSLKKNFNKLITAFDEPHEKLIFNLLLIALFSIIYKVIDIYDKNAFSQPLQYSDSLYFSSITNFTLGYGDILPKSILAKTAVVLHSFLFWMVAIA
jgi:hypothetical protein